MSTSRKDLLLAECEKLTAISIALTDPKRSAVIDKANKYAQEFNKKLLPDLIEKCGKIFGDVMPIFIGPLFKTQAAMIAVVQSDLKTLANFKKDVDQSVGEIKKVQDEYKALSDQLNTIRSVIFVGDIPSIDIDKVEFKFDSDKSATASGIALGKAIAQGMVTIVCEKETRGYFRAVEPLVNDCIALLATSYETTALLSKTCQDKIDEATKVVEKGKKALAQTLANEKARVAAAEAAKVAEAAKTETADKARLDAVQPKSGAGPSTPPRVDTSARLGIRGA